MENLKFEKLNIGVAPAYIFEQVDSTNAVAKSLVLGGANVFSAGASQQACSCNGSCTGNLVCNSAALTKDEIPHGTVIIADSQTAGRGRLGRTFASPAGSGLYMSIVLRPSEALFNPMLVTCAAGVATTKALKKVCGIDADIKWVNDILVNDKKLCGILAEGMMNTCSGSLDAIILGIGINLKAPGTGYPEEIADIVTNIEEVLSEIVASPALSEIQDWKNIRNKLAQEITENVIALLSSETSDEEIIEFYKEACGTIGKNILVYKHGLSGEALPAKAVGINKDGGLIVQYESTDPDIPGSIETITFGEISVRQAK